MGSLTGRVALITGASQSTGRAIAQRFAAEGAKVALTARSEEGLRETVAQIEKAGGAAMAIPCDLGDPNGGRASLIERTETALGPLDILVNNAVGHGQGPLTRVDEWKIAELERLAHINLWAPWDLMARAMPGMKQRKRGWILNLTSFGGELMQGPPFISTGRDGGVGYCTMKAALNRLTVAAAGELESSGVAVNALTPQRSILSPERIASGSVTDTSLFEPLDTMAEAALALCTGDPAVLTGRIAYSLQLLLELQRPTRDLQGKALVEGWQPQDLPKQILTRQNYNEKAMGWAECFNFHRANTPYSDALRQGR
jgi:NAD(P)-dependent dehydrogenase (short-subunit alcohol dehydrogenase family)